MIAPRQGACGREYTLLYYTFEVGACNVARVGSGKAAVAKPLMFGRICVTVLIAMVIIAMGFRIKVCFFEIFLYTLVGDD